ncbi:HD domain-containing protein [Candidatus Parcubacteria bacterium]|nr:HD domain-containing protein [Candidatus Parcubacteria bacterium]
MAPNKPKRDIDLLFEIGSLRNVPRAWQQVLSGRVQNIVEHTFRATMIAWMLAIAEGADVSKVIRMMLVHDMGESRTGDIAFLHRGYVVRHEDQAEKDMFEDTIMAKDTAALLKEYEERKTLESRIVKDADNLDVDLELKEMVRIGDTAAERMMKEHRPHVRSTKLYTKTAKKMWDDIKKSDPNAWHMALAGKWVKNKKSGK